MMKMIMAVFLVIPFINFFSWYVFSVYILVLFIYLLNIFLFNYYFSFMSYFVGGDLLSISLIMLTIWIIFLMLVASFMFYKCDNHVYEFIFVLNFLMFFLLVSFSVNNLFYYYLFFECSLIPTLILIFGWGYQPERLEAGYYLLFYTLFFSLPLLLGIFYLNNFYMSVSYFLIDSCFGLYFYLSMTMAFLVKIPMIFTHFWLPKAHVEAPISGSMILAGVLLKLGGYGLIRVFYFLKNMLYMNYIFSCLSLFGMVMVGFVCLFQVDMKSMIAYSSVSHMGMVICGIMAMNYWGILGSLVLMIGHGLCSSGMFCLANIIYDRSGSRSLLINKGFITIMPSMCMFWFLLSVNNMASPPSLNLLGEIMLINGIFSWSVFSMVYLMICSFMGCAYSIYLYSSVNHGEVYKGIISVSNGYFAEFILLFMHWFPLNILFMKVDIFSLLI